MHLRELFRRRPVGYLDEDVDETEDGHGPMVVERLSPQWWDNTISRWLGWQPPVVFTFVLSQLSSARVLGALPAVAALLGVGALGAKLRWVDEPVKPYYERAAREAVGDRRLEDARILFERLAIMNGRTPETLFALAMICMDQGQRARAVQLLRPLAPRDRAGYPAAQIFVARHYLAGPTPQHVRVGEQHLRMALKGDPENATAHHLLASLLHQRGQLDEAISHLSRAVSLRPEWRIELARLSRKRAAQLDPARRDQDIERLRAEARRELAEAVRLLRQKLDLEPSSVEQRGYLVAALCAQGAFEQAQRITEQGIAIGPAEFYRKMRASVRVAWADMMFAERRHVEGLALLVGALSDDPRNSRVVARTIQLGRGDDAAAVRVRSQLMGLLASNVAPEAVHFVIGVIHLERKNLDLALRHLERAHALAPGLGEVANNLAWALTLTDPPDLNRALALATRAVSLDPARKVFHGTRGRVLFLLGRHAEAAEVLKKSYAPGGGTRELHAMLAACYRQLGLPELAEAHRLLALRRRR